MIGMNGGKRWGTPAQQGKAGLLLLPARGEMKGGISEGWWCKHGIGETAKQLEARVRRAIFASIGSLDLCLSCIQWPGWPIVGSTELAGVVPFQR